VRTIDVTSGGAEYVTATITEHDGQALDAATIAVGLGTLEAKPTTWQPPDGLTFPSAGVAKASLLIDSADQIGARQALWVKVGDAPEVLYRVAGNDLITVL
jgi:hypothetical protein